MQVIGLPYDHDPVKFSSVRSLLNLLRELEIESAISLNGSVLIWHVASLNERLKDKYESSAN